MTRKEEIELAWFGKEVQSNHRYDEKTFKEAVEWADRTMVDKACEWIKEIHIEKNIGSLHSGPYSMTFDKDTFIEEFRKAMLEEEHK